MIDQNLPASRLECVVRKALPLAKALTNTLTGVDNFVDIYKATLPAIKNPKVIPNALYTTAYGLIGTAMILTGDLAVGGSIFRIVSDITNVERKGYTAGDTVIGLFLLFPTATVMYILSRMLHNEYVRKSFNLKG